MKRRAALLRFVLWKGLRSMGQLDVPWLAGELERLGLMLSATPRTDGSHALARWRTVRYWDHAEEAEALWSSLVAGNTQVQDELAKFVVERGPYVPSVTTVSETQAPLVPDDQPPKNKNAFTSDKTNKR
jgi:hypothetical protein